MQSNLNVNLSTTRYSNETREIIKRLAFCQISLIIEHLNNPVNDSWRVVLIWNAFVKLFIVCLITPYSEKTNFKQELLLLCKLSQDKFDLLCDLIGFDLSFQPHVSFASLMRPHFARINNKLLNITIAEMIFLGYLNAKKKCIFNISNNDVVIKKHMDMLYATLSEQSNFKYCFAHIAYICYSNDDETKMVNMKELTADLCFWATLCKKFPMLIAPLVLMQRLFSHHTDSNNNNNNQHT